MNRMLTAAGMVKDAMEAAAKMVAQMVAGAWSSIHATYGISASASASSSYSAGKSVEYRVDTDTPPIF